jgi:hypothetical protein
MSANVDFYDGGPSLFQAVGVMGWTWQLGDNVSFWGFSVRPLGANNQAALTSVSASADNDLVQTTFMTVVVADAAGPNVRTGGGGILKFTAIGSS